VSEILTPQNGDNPNDERPRLVLDTNTVLALWMFRDPKLDALREWIEAGKCRLYSRGDALEELRRVLAYRQFGLDEAAQVAMHTRYRSRLAPWSPPPDAETERRISTTPRCRDEDDQKFLEIAHTLGATHLLTRDKALLRLNGHRLVREHFRILTPEQFQKDLPSHSTR
jgi:predicted nucleic acid-binding protein